MTIEERLEYALSYLRRHRHGMDHWQVEECLRAIEKPVQAIPASRNSEVAGRSTVSYSGQAWEC